MTLGYRPGTGVLHRAHPFTVLALAGTVAVLAFTLSAPLGPMLLTAGLVAIAVAARVSRTLLTALAFAAPFWVFLVLIHVVFGDSPDRAVTVGSQISAVLVVFLMTLAAVHPGRLVDALLERGVPFHVAYLLVATLQSVPELQRRASAILDAQRCRGLRVRGSVWGRVRSVVPLAVPLVLGALGEVDDRALALEARGAASGLRRTPLDPPHDRLAERVTRWALLGSVLGTIAWRIVA
ncbi:MAG: energy-coupling factor transporter transmembrane protein EcfT [Gemmatimonadota bacterium]|nr:energy-coupling factor transporter transmembrane protein EcfT [Gemmatimonadota bacterium]MDH3367246.1 energy-coupling factor transporter transmembrane protein EcfT [Gemmatimonadota bacterium]MDH3478398.1 energy-coupling factor transporter transmembrane protein EcfT [Gemmatimonadota bacterium]MDH3570461.1 energy-coupling factor transporter transmembrane protein EcfT [Gemmatimonadota bacterium]MDH5548946.1 energy-coupling factor transporter transmembrane protein EcfT [Gemmatimonadota bacterium